MSLANKDDISGASLDSGGKLQPQPMCPADQVWDASLGRCVQRGAVGAWSPVGELENLRTRVRGIIEHRIRLRQDGALGPGALGNRQVDDRDESDEFLLFELLLAVAFAERALSFSDERILPLYDDQALPDDPGRFNQSRLDDATRQAAQRWEREFYTDKLDDVVRLNLGRSFAAGEAQISSGITAGSPQVQRVLENMVAMTDFRSNDFFNTQVIPSLQRSVSNMFETGNFTPEALRSVRGQLDRRLKSVPYWRVVANANATRSFHYGMLRAARAQGRRGYRFVAIIDERTSDICRQMDGKEWLIADVLNKFEQVAASDDPDEVKRVFPWVSADDVMNLEDDALRDLGVMVPPLHGNCRSTLTIL